MNSEKLKNFLRKWKIPSVTRVSLNIRLKKEFKKLKPGKVLDIGSKRSPYQKLVHHTFFLTMDIDPKFKPNVVSDIHNIQADPYSFDTIIATEILEHCQNPLKAVQELHRVLKKGGICILSTRFIEKYHPNPKDYYRFTWDSLGDIFSKFSEVRIVPLGNRLQAIWSLLCIGYPFTPLALLNPLIGRINFKRTSCPNGFIVVAKK